MSRYKDFNHWVAESIPEVLEVPGGSVSAFTKGVKVCGEGGVFSSVIDVGAGVESDEDGVSPAPG
jgi:hypothetical protein